MFTQLELSILTLVTKTPKNCFKFQVSFLNTTPSVVKTKQKLILKDFRRLFDGCLSIHFSRSYCFTRPSKVLNCEE